MGKGAKTAQVEASFSTVWHRQAVCARLAYELYRHRHTDTHTPHTTHRRERDKQPEPGGSQQAEGKLFEPTQRYPPPSSRSDRFYNIEVFVSGFLPPSSLGKWCIFFCSQLPRTPLSCVRGRLRVCVCAFLFDLLSLLYGHARFLYHLFRREMVRCVFGLSFFFCFCSFPVYRFPWKISNSSFPRSSPFFFVVGSCGLMLCSIFN